MYCLVSYIQLFFNPLLLQDVALISYQLFLKVHVMEIIWKLLLLLQEQEKDITYMFMELSHKQLPLFLGRYTFPVYVQQTKKYFQKASELP